MPDMVEVLDVKETVKNYLTDIFLGNDKHLAYILGSSRNIIFDNFLVRRYTICIVHSVEKF